MAVITVEIPDELMDQVAQLRDRLPELLTLSLQRAGNAVGAVEVDAAAGVIDKIAAPARVGVYAERQAEKCPQSYAVRRLF
jgi:hypothetical protein